MTREWDAASYHRLSDPQFGWGLKVLDRVPVRGGETVLDAGCGTGRLTAELVQRLQGGRVVAVDLSENMLAAAQTTLAPFGDRASRICADLQQLPFCRLFDGIFSTATFHWAKNHPRLFASLFTALKPGGWLVAQCGGGPNLARHRERARRLMASPRYAPFFAGWSEPWEYATPELTAERLSQAGFTKVETWLEPAGFELPDREVFRQYVATVTLRQHVARITDENLRDQFVSELVDQASADPDFTFDYWRLNINARRP